MNSIICVNGLLAKKVSNTCECLRFTEEIVCIGWGICIVPSFTGDLKSSQIL